MNICLKVMIDGVEKIIGPITRSEEPMPPEVIPFDGKFYTVKGGRVTGAMRGTPSQRIFYADEIANPDAQP